MTAAFLQSELASLIQDAKRRQSDVRTAAEKSLADLKAIHVTSETQLAGDLLRRPQFIDPFLLACRSKYIKLTVTATVCLQRLVASKAIPPARLADVLDAFQDAAQQGLDVQLKILQALPSLLQLYANELQGDAFAKILSLCALLTGSKTALVSSTATATFQQLVSSLFEKDTKTRNHGENDEEGLDDASKVFDDMCLIISGEQPQFLKTHGLTLPLALEVVELSLSNPKKRILDMQSCAASCEQHLIPGIVQILQRSTSFSAFGRGLRILYVLVTTVLETMFEPMSDSFIEILSIMDRPSGPPWRRLLCLEFMKNTIAEAQLFRKVFALFDCHEGRRPVVGDLMSILVRIASEDPALIGLGRQSTIPTNSENETNHTGGAHVDIDAVGSVLQASANVTGVSSRWSTLEYSLLEHSTGQTLPNIPETYIYTLILDSVASLSDGLSKYVMPFSVPSRPVPESLDNGDTNGLPSRKNSQFRRAEKYQRLLNPLKRDDISYKEEINICARLIENCWPAILATCSTFLNSALDSHFYHILVRTVQKLAQVSGVLELFTPRDALLTTLAKVSVPVNASSVVTAVHGNKLARIAKDDDEDETDDVSLKSPIPTTPRMSVDVSRQPLNVRNLLCLRALLNLGIALGPTLSETSWFIIVQASQQADALMSVNPAARAATNKSQSQDEVDVEGHSNLGSEITAVGTASKRMLESTRSYTDESLETFLRSVFKMIDTLTMNSASEISNTSPNSNQGLTVNPRRHRATRSVSGAFTTAVVLHVEAEFVLRTINDLARINLHRFCSNSSRSCTWDLIVVKLLSIVEDYDINMQLRLQAATTLASISMETIKMLEKLDKDSEELDTLQNVCLKCLDKQISLLYKRRTVQAVLVTDIDIHRRVLEALENIVSHSGDSLTTGWRVVFDMLQRSIRQDSSGLNGARSSEQSDEQEQILERTIPTAFRVVQLIISDFLRTIDPVSFSILVQLLPLFGLQRNDLNISLTTTVLFSNLSSLLLERVEVIEMPPQLISAIQETDQTMAMLEQRATNIPSLWFAIVRQLCRLCTDSRGDVRNSALHVLVRLFESSGPQLSTTAWNAALLNVVIPVLEHYTKADGDVMTWHVSFAQLLQGVVDLFVPNIEKITTCAAFATTWKALTSVLEAKLVEQSLDGHEIVFSSAAELLRALHTTTVNDSEYAMPMLQMWLKYHPARITLANKSNQNALNAHARLFASVVEHSDGATIEPFAVIDGQSLVELAKTATKQTLLSSIHPPYTSDVAKLAPEQSTISDNIKLIKAMLVSRRHEYTSFLLDLIGSILVRNVATEVELQQIAPGTTSSMKRPTLMAFMFRCLTMIREVIREEADREDFLYTTCAPETLLLMSKIAATKYSGIPSSPDVHVWKEATRGATELVETARTHVKCIQATDIEALAQPIFAALASILNAPAFEDKKTPPTSSMTAVTAESIAVDEAFDIDHLTRYHVAAEVFLQHPSFPEQVRKQYVLQLFHTSLVTRPWYGDFPSDLENDPLANLREVRRGSVRSPDVFRRGKIPYEALKALFDLVIVDDRNNDSNSESTSSSSNSTSKKLAVAKTAAPYVLLRIAHPLKQFQADQRLRNLIPPPQPLPHEMAFILRKALDLDVIDDAFDGLSSSSSSSKPSSSTPRASPSQASATPGRRDGKSHLRVLCPVVLDFERFWTRLPRLRVCAWQDEDDGRVVADAVRVWIETCVGSL